MKQLLLALCVAALSATSTARELSSGQSQVLKELGTCHDAVPASTDKPFNSPCGFKTDVSILKGVSYSMLLRSLGPPEVCYVADGNWQSPACTKGAAPGLGVLSTSA